MAYLLLAAGLFCWANWDLNRARGELAAARQRLSGVQQAHEQTVETARRAQAAQGLLREASSQGLAPSAWAERRIHIRQATMRRAEANALLSELVRTPDRLFGAEEFELSVRDPREGLFSQQSDPAATVQVPVRGSMVFRTGGGGS